MNEAVCCFPTTKKGIRDFLATQQESGELFTKLQSMLNSVLRPSSGKEKVNWNKAAGTSHCHRGKPAYTGK
jgi:hypothetical protein